jgi:hypothetical protein
MATDPRRCALNRELISAMLDGELSSDERVQLMNHLAGCPECRALLDGYRAIGAQLRAMPAAQAPQELRADIYAATIDAEPRRLFFLTSKLGYSVAALAAVALLFVVAGYLLVGGYQRSVTPAIENSKPLQGSIWPVNNPIEITFNKPMDHASVENALAIQPDGEEARLDISWRGNTLVIGQTTPLQAGSSYGIRITTAARDKWGHRLETDFALSFGTAPSFAIADTPTPQPTAPPTATVPPTNPTTQSAVGPSVTSTPQGPNPTATTAPAAPTPTAPNSGPGVGPTQPTGGEAGPTPTTAPDTGSIDATATPTEPPHEDVPTATPTLAPADVPTEAPADTPTPTPTDPEPTATATTAPAPTETPIAPTETPSTIGVTGDLGSVYWANDSVRERLGDPSAAASSSTNQILGFNGGNMYLKGDTNDIYVMALGGSWDRFPNTATTDPPFTPAPDPSFWIPGGAFGVLWTNEPSVQSSLGYALSASVTTFDGAFQQFAGGVMLSTPTDVLIFYSDGSWDFLPIVNATGDSAPPQ